MVVCDSQEERRKLATAASTSGVAAVAGGHGETSSMDEKLSVLRGIMVVLSRSCLQLWRERERVNGVPANSVLPTVLLFHAAA